MRTRPGIPPSPARRALDVGVAAVALTLLSPALLVIAVAVRLTSAGPVIYRQARVGQGGALFDLLKFRSMRHGLVGPDITAPDDPRVTPIGRFLRRTSLDELPQLVNVLTGDMTLVGPRPETPALAARYPAEFQFLFLHRPGVTGPVQVRLRDQDVIPPDIDDVEAYYLQDLLPARVALDCGYLANPTLARTIRLLWETAAYLARWPRRQSVAQPAEAAR